MFLNFFPSFTEMLRFGLFLLDISEINNEQMEIFIQICFSNGLTEKTTLIISRLSLLNISKCAWIC